MEPLHFDSLSDALKRCPPGYFVVPAHGTRTEYDTQYLKDRSGHIYWTAGGTVGGSLEYTEVPNKKPLSGGYHITNSLTGPALTEAGLSSEKELAELECSIKKTLEVENQFTETELKLTDRLKRVDISSLNPDSPEYHAHLLTAQIAQRIDQMSEWYPEPEVFTNNDVRRLLTKGAGVVINLLGDEVGSGPNGEHQRFSLHSTVKLSVDDSSHESSGCIINALMRMFHEIND